MKAMLDTGYVWPIAINEDAYSTYYPPPLPGITSSNWPIHLTVIRL